jgi:hypothetical protein
MTDEKSIYKVSEFFLKIFHFPKKSWEFPDFLNGKVEKFRFS